MSNATTSRLAERPANGRAGSSTEQLTLLPSSEVSTRFLINKETHERGLRHIAEIRQILAGRTDDHRRAA